MVKLEGVLYVMLLLLPLATLQYDRDIWQAPQDDDGALNLLRTIKRRVSNQLRQQEESDTNDYDNFNVLATVKRRQKKCRNWNDPCVPWSNDADEVCCNSRRFVCRCNLWMQNCRCVSRAWGK